MNVNYYEFRTRWRVQAALAEVYSILADAESLPRWWPAVYFDVRQIHCAGGDGVGTEFALTTRGWLPYILRWQFRVADVRPGEGYSLEAFGDFTGQGDWRFTQEGEHVEITYDWSLNANKPLLKYLSPLLKPLFALNHQWAMRTGLDSLKLELLRRRAQSINELAAIPPPRAPSNSGPVIAGISAAVLTLASLAVIFCRYRRPATS